MAKDLELEERKEETQDKRPSNEILRFTLSEIREHFDESIASIQSHFAISEILLSNGNVEAAKDIWRSQILFLESTLDFYIHELSKYGMCRMFTGGWEQSTHFQRFPVDMECLIEALDASDQDSWLLKYANKKFSRDVYLSFDAMRDQLKLLKFDFTEIMTKAFKSLGKQSDSKAGEKIVRDLFSRRNQIAHQSDRTHSTAERCNINKEYVENSIKNVCDLVTMIHLRAEEKDRNA